jgi:hypothetical protein
MHSEAIAYLSDSELIYLSGRRIALQRQVVGKRDPMTARQGKHFMRAVRIERNEREQPIRRSVLLSPTTMLNHQHPTATCRRQRDNQSADHRVTFSESLCGAKNWPFSYIKTECSSQTATVGQTELGAQLSQDRPERLVPTPAVDPHPALGQLPRTTHPRVDQSQLTQPAPRRVSDTAQEFHLRSGDRQLQQTHAGNLDGQVVQRSSALSAELRVAIYGTQHGCQTLPGLGPHSANANRAAIDMLRRPGATTHFRVTRRANDGRGVQIRSKTR